MTTAEGPSRLSVTLAAPRARGESVSRARVRVVALQATAGALGVELGRAVGANVWVAPDVAPARVTFAGEYTVEALALALRSADVALEVSEDGAIALGEWSVRASFNREEFERRRQVRESRASQMLEVVEARLFPVSERTNAATLARYFCRRLASDRGAAAVFRRWVVVSDTAANLNHFELLLREVDRPPAPREPTPVAPSR